MTFHVYTRSVLPLAKEPTVTIHTRGLLSLNGAAYLALGRPPAVALLFDRGTRTIGLRQVEPTFPESRFVRAGSGRANGPFLIAATTFLRHYDLEFGRTLRWPAEFEDGLLCVDLSIPGLPVTSNRAATPHQPALRIVDQA